MLQLGYSVSCGVRQTYGTLGFCFQVVASKFPVEALTSAVLAFVASIPDTVVAGFSAEAYLDNLRAVRAHKRTPVQSLNEAAQMLREEVEEGHGCLHVAHKQADLLDREEDFSQEALVRFSREVFLEKPRLLLVQATLAERQDVRELPEPFRGSCRVAGNIDDPTKLAAMFPERKPERGGSAYL
jgi:secreted Zn-dependent insulinase-like peptidase